MPNFEILFVSFSYADGLVSYAFSFKEVLLAKVVLSRLIPTIAEFCSPCSVSTAAFTSSMDLLTPMLLALITSSFIMVVSWKSALSPYVSLLMLKSP